MLIEPRIVAWAHRGPKWRRVPRARVAAEEQLAACSQPHGNGSHLRPHPRRETIEESIGIYSSCSTRSDIEREASVCVTISIYLLSLEIQSRSISIDLE